MPCQPFQFPQRKPYPPSSLLNNQANTTFGLRMSLISQNAVRKSKKVDADHERVVEEESDREKEYDQMIKKRKRSRKEQVEKAAIEDEREMKKLESFLFGSIHNPVGFEAEDGLDRAIAPYQGEEELLNVAGIEEDEARPRKPVWVDEEEEEATISIAKVNRLRKLRKEEGERLVSGTEYVSRLRAQHAKLNPGTEWARLDFGAGGDSYSDDDDERDEVVLARGYKDVEAIDDLLRTNEDLVVKSHSKLLSGNLDCSRLVDANVQEPSKGVINSVQFHKNAQLLLTAGLDRRLRFFQIDGKRNTKIQSIFLDDCPIHKASFLPNGSQVIVSGRRKFFYTFDLVNAKVDKVGPLVGREEKSLELFEVSPDSSTIAFVGNEGYILLVSSKTKELIGTLKMNGTVRSLAFADDGKTLLSCGGDGQVYHWDLRTRTCLHKGVDEGCINGTALATSPNGALFASGSDSGIVNVYNRDEFLGGKRKPMKTVENLTTRVDFMKFNSDAQILAICSRMKKSSLKLVHVPSFTVFSNWPPANKALKYPRCLDFSPGGGFMAIGNAAGNVMLYKLHHYNHA